MDKGGTLANEPKNKKIDDDVQSLTPRDDIDNMYQGKKEKEG